MRTATLIAGAIAAWIGGSACDRDGQAGTPVGMIAMFDGVCPEGWTRYAALDGRFARGADVAGGVGGEEDHVHAFDITARTSRDGAHIHMLAGGEKVDVDSGLFGHIGISDGYLQAFEEGGRMRNRAQRARAVTDSDGVHDHLISVTGDSEAGHQLPPYLDVIYCRKD